MAVLARVRDFLPMMANSNTELLKKMEENPEDVDIENTDGDEQVIAMVRGCVPISHLNSHLSNYVVFGGVQRCSLICAIRPHLVLCPRYLALRLQNGKALNNDAITGVVVVVSPAVN